MVINLTQHKATPKQSLEGVVDLNNEQLELLKELLTFDAIPTRQEINLRAEGIAELACQNGLGEDHEDCPTFTRAMIGGAPYLMSALESALLDLGITPVYAFSERVSVEEEINGTVVKRNVFKHVGFVETCE